MDEEDKQRECNCARQSDPESRQQLSASIDAAVVERKWHGAERAFFLEREYYANQMCIFNTRISHPGLNWSAFTANSCCSPLEPTLDSRFSSANPRRRIPAVNDETRKSAVLVAAAIFAARALSDWDGKRSPKAIAAAANGIEKAQLLVTAFEAKEK